MSRAIVFAYHNVGVRCLSVLLAHGVDVALVVTHRDNPKETIWFDSVAELAALHDIPTITPDNPNVPEVVARYAPCSRISYFRSITAKCSRASCWRYPGKERLICTVRCCRNTVAAFR